MDAAGLAYPKPILCPHENTAVHMAGGYAAATGRGQAVLVHVDAGTANAAMGLHNLARARIPVLVMAGDEDPVCPLEDAQEIVAALRNNNLQVAGGAIGAPPFNTDGLMRLGADGQRLIKLRQRIHFDFDLDQMADAGARAFDRGAHTARQLQQFRKRRSQGHFEVFFL